MLSSVPTLGSGQTVLGLQKRLLQAPEQETHQCLSDSAVLNLRACSSSMGSAKSYTQ
jgi:hypothetical protein